LKVTQLVSETEDGPTMPFDAWCALQHAKIAREITAFMDENAVPVDSPLRGNALRAAAALADKVFAADAAELESSCQAKH
jgi:hypothetical protein